MTNVEVTKENIENQFTNAVDYFGLYIPNLLSFYALFTKRVNNDIFSIRICVKTDVTPVLEYNEQWLVNCDRSVFVFILSIEMYRFILHHCTHRELTGPNAFKASTATCNSKELEFFLSSAPEELAKYVRNTVWSKKLIEEEINKKISEQDYYYESVYQLLNKNSETQQQSSHQGSKGDQDGQEKSEEGQSSQGDQGNEDQEGADSEGEEGQEGESSGSKSGGSSGDDSDEERTGDAESSSGASQQPGSEGDSDGDPSDGESSGSGSNSGDSRSNGKGSGKEKGQNPKKEAFDDWNHSGEENTQEWGANNIVDEMIRDVVENKCKVTGWGKLSGEQVEEIMLKNRRKVNITPIIAGFGASVRCRNKVQSRLRLNKRYGIVFPGYRYDRKTKMLFLIDSSASMSDNDIRKGCEILHNFYKKTEIDLAFWDAKMVKPQKLKKNFQKVTAPGRGGTDPACIGEYIKENNLHYDGYVIFTDCIWEWKENNLGPHIFVISSEKEYTVPKFVKHHASIQQLTHVFDD